MKSKYIIQHVLDDIFKCSLWLKIMITYSYQLYQLMLPLLSTREICSIISIMFTKLLLKIHKKICVILLIGHVIMSHHVHDHFLLTVNMLSPIHIYKNKHTRNIEDNIVFGNTKLIFIYIFISKITSIFKMNKYFF